LMLDIWTEKRENPAEWHEIALKLIPKKGNLQLPQNWRPICLIDVLLKVQNAIIAHRLDMHLASGIGIAEQNGFTTGRGCTDGTAALKMALQNLKDVGQDSYVVFIDLVKAFDSVNREMLWKLLPKFGVPRTLVAIIRRSYKNVYIQGCVNTEQFEFESLSGVKQGDPLSPVLFLFAMQAALELAEKNWPATIPTFEWFPQSRKDGLPEGYLTQRIDSKSAASLFEYYRSLFADDAAFMFQSREDAKKGTQHLINAFAAFGLEVHVGRRTADGTAKESKTKYVHFPHDAAIEPDTTCLELADGCHIAGDIDFKYLGSIISATLDDSIDIKLRISKGENAFNFMRPVLLNKKIPDHLRSYFFQS
ncbi:MAG: RNA-directed DNA polymerase, partial [Gaiellaceae bacterium]